MTDYTHETTAQLKCMIAGAVQFLSMAITGDLVKYGCSRSPTPEEIEDVNRDLAAMRAELRARMRASAS